MATLGGARALGLEAEIGSLRVGKRADFVAFDFRRPHVVPRVNLLGNLVHNAQGRDVEHVWVDGDAVVESGRPVKTDLDTILADALWKRAREGADRAGADGLPARARGSRGAIARRPGLSPGDGRRSGSSGPRRSAPRRRRTG